MREADWQVAPPAPGLADRRVEITGPTDAKMAINALNSGAKVWLADLEDANTPLWENMVQGQLNLRDAVAGTLDVHHPEGKHYSARRRDRDDRGPAPRLAPAPRSTCSSTASGCRAACSTSASTSSTAPRPSSTAAPARTSTCPRWRATSRPGSGTTSSCWPRTSSGIPAGTIRATVLIETVPGGVRDGGDPLRAARPLGRAQRRPLGLHVQHDQELPRPRRATSCCPTAARSR